MCICEVHDDARSEERDGSGQWAVDVNARKELLRSSFLASWILRNCPKVELGRLREALYSLEPLQQLLDTPCNSF